MDKDKNLEINKDVVLDDGSEAKEELEKEAEKSDKETEKELAKSVKIVDEINDAEAGKPELKDVDGKKVKFTEGLINEDGEDLQPMIDYLIDIYDNDAGLILKDILDTECANKVIPTLYAKATESIDEDIRDVKDLGKAYSKRNFFRRGDNRNTDYHHAKYEEITPEEAYKLIKQGKALDLRLLVDGDLITLKDTGYGSTDYRSQWVDHDKAYYKKSGEMVRDTAHMPIKHLLGTVADKIYLTNENEAKKDPDLLAARAKNPESPNYNGPTLNSLNTLRSVDDNSSTRYRNDFDTNAEIRGASRRLSSTFARGKKPHDNWYADQVKKYRQRYKELRDLYSKGEIDQDSYEKRRADVLNDLKYYSQEVYKASDDFARARYANSEIALQKELNNVIDLKLAAKNKSRDVKRAKEKLDNAIANGAESTRENRARLKDYSNELRELQKKMALIAFKLEDTSEEDTAAAKQYKDAYDSVNNQYTDIMNQLDQILNRRKK